MRISRRAFTLLELVVTMLIVAVLLTCVVGIVMATVDAKLTVESETRARKLGPAIVEIITRDLRNSWATGPDPAVAITGSFFKGANHGDDQEAADEVNFVTTVDSYMRYQGQRSDITEVGYYVKDNPQGDGLKSLYRREDFSVDASPDEGGRGVRMTDRVVSFKVRYFERPTNQEDASAYDEVIKDERALPVWDSKEKNTVPYAVKIELILDVTPTDSYLAKTQRRIGVYSAIVRLPDYPELKDNFKLFDLVKINVPKPAPDTPANPNDPPPPNNPPPHDG